LEAACLLDLLEGDAAPAAAPGVKIAPDALQRSRHVNRPGTPPVQRRTGLPDARPPPPPADGAHPKKVTFGPVVPEVEKPESAGPAPEKGADA
jgi:hypothetical protein